MSRFAQLMVQSAPIANLEEEEIEDEDEYTYEEYDEEEGEEGEEISEEFTDLGKNNEKADGQIDEKFKDGNWPREELIDEALWRLIQIPSDALERESAASLHWGNSIFWAPDPIEAFRLCQLLQDGDEMPTEKGAQVPVKMVVEEMDEIIGKELKEEANGKKMVPWECLQRPSVSHLCMDMTQLSELNEPSVLECIRRRYHSHRLIHTYSGLFCVVVNPWQQLAGLYSAKMRSFYAQQGSAADLPPHVFSIAQSAFDGICSPARSSQAILITGESGAGKTENTKRIIEYLIDVSSRQNGPQQNGGPNCCAVDSALVAAGTALEAFGNAQTVHNDNSSRLGKFIRIEFEPGKGRLISARIDCYLLEKSRVVSQNPGDRNFHIFYRLLANSRFLASERAQRILHRISGIEPKAGQFRFLNQGMAGESVHAKFVDDLEGGRETEVALDQLGFSGEEKGWLREMMLACALIGQIRFGERAGMDLSFVEGIDELEAVAEMLQIRQSNKLMDALTQPSIRVGETLIRKTQPLKKTLASAQALAKCLYERIFGWLLAKCNGAIGANGKTAMEGKDTVAGTFVGVLDMAGFEIMARNSFEQLCINYTNERLQQFFNEFMFVREQQEYCREGIRWEQQSYGRDLQPTIDLIEKPLGILSLLQEECIVPNGSEQSLLDKMVQRLSANANVQNGQQAVFSRAKLSSKTQNSGHFTVAHYAGQVNYNVDGWLEKNRDSVDQCLLEVLAQSEHPLLAKLFSTSPVMAPKIQQQQQRKGSAMAQASISFVYREQLANLLDTLRQCHAHFVRCVVPNHQRIPFLLDGRLTMHQLRCNGVLEGIRICRRGYPNRIPFAEFLSRYRILSPNFDIANGNSFSTVQSFCHNLGLDPDRFQIGKSKVFCRVGFISELETMRRTKLAQILTGLQAQIRFYWTQIDMRRRKEEWIALVSIQRAVRRQIQLKNWPWYRVWLKVRELIPLVHQKRRLVELEIENRELHKKLGEEAAKLEWSQRELEEQKDRLERVEQQRTEEKQNAEELKAELKRNEELLEKMEKKWDEQHAKVMRLNGTLGEQARALERLEEERNTAKLELTELRERHRMECLERESADEALAAAQEENVRLRSNADEMLAEMSRMRGEMDKTIEEMDELREKAREREEELADLNRALVECNDRLGEMQPQLHSERSARRKAEALADDLGQELGRIGEELDRATAKRDAMKEQLRAREVQTRKLERKLEDKQAEMDDFLAELRRAHKKGQTDLQEQLDEWRRKSLKLETENAQLKCKLEAQNAMETATNSYRASGGSGSRFGSCQALDRDQRDSSVDSDCGGGGAYGLHRSLTRQTVQYPTGSLQRRRFNGGAGILGQSTMTDSFEPGLHRSASGTTSSMGNLSSSAHSTSTSSSRRRAAANRAMITSLTATVDSGLLTRSPSSTSTVSGGQYLNMSQRVDAAERKLLEKEREIQSQRQEAQMAKRELEVYKQTLQESERSRDQLGKQVRQLTFEMEKLGQRLKAEEERTQSAEFETRKLATECGTIRQKLEEQREEAEQEMVAERKRNMEKADQLAHEYELRLRQLGNSQRSQEQLLERLTDAESQLDKARAQLAHMERLQRTQSAIGETWEAQYRQAQQDLEGARDENAALKSRIRRQQKQIELLNQQSELSERVNELESRVGQVQDRFGNDKPNGGMNRREEARKKNSLGEDENESKSDEEEEVETDIQVLTFNCNY